MVTEGALKGPDDFSQTTGNVEWVGTTMQDSALGVRFAPNTVVRTFYPNNPRGYFDEPDALQRRWVLQTHEGSRAQLEFPSEKPGVLRINIADSPSKIGWHVSLRQAPIRVLAGERYQLRFRARSDSVRTLYVAISQAHPPGKSLGLSREIRVDSSWRDFTQTFRATESDRAAQIYFELGADHPAVELSGITMLAISTSSVVQAEARRELSVSYQINSLGCRGPEYPMRTDSGSWRILSLGGGGTFGVGVHQLDTYASRLEALLNEAGTSRGPEGHYDVINCGTPGISAEQQRLLLISLWPHYSPNLVLFAVGPDHDSIATEGVRQSAGPSITNLERLFRVWGLARSLGRPKPLVPDFATTVDNIKQVDADARARGARVAVVLFQQRLGPDWKSLDSALTKGLRGSNIPMLNLGPVLLSFGEQKLFVHSVLDRHPNELAHRISAEALRKFLSDQGLLGEAHGAGTVVVDTSGARE
ncbi:MAG: carbohydrate binding domain-containing protein [Gemmatimonadaceae bacterium]|nr:carbohydrate binding domain-containing protein [Gemmatimonadaceae bacterium]